MKVYIAAPGELQQRALDLAYKLRGQGFLITSRWLTVDLSTQQGLDQYAREDLADIDEADAFVALNPAEWARIGTGGRHFECGYAYHAGKWIVVVGARTNIFHYLSDVAFLESDDALVATLNSFSD